MKIERKEREKNVSGKNFFFFVQLFNTTYLTRVWLAVKKKGNLKRKLSWPQFFFSIFFSGFVLGLDLSLHTFMLCANLLERN